MTKTQESYITIRIRRGDQEKLTAGMIQEAARRKKRLTLAGYTSEVIEAGLKALATPERPVR